MPDWVLVAADQAVGVALAGSGAVVLLRRRERRVALLLGFASATWFLGSLFGPLVFLHRGPMVHLHLSYPTGRLHRRLAVVAVVAAYAWAVAEGWTSQPALTAGLAGLVAAAAADGYRHITGPARRAGWPGFVAALLFASVLALSAANLLLGLRADVATALAYDAVMVVVAAWLAADLIRGGWTESTLAELVVQLGGSPEGVGLEAELRRALGDPDLVLGYWDERAQRYVDGSGTPVEPAGPGVTRVAADGRPVAVLLHDPALLADPSLLEGAASALRLAVSNARLRAEIRDRVEELATARRRTVEAADAQRRALQAELAAGPEAELSKALEALDGAAVDASLQAEVQGLVAGIQSAVAEFRRFAGGLRPEVLEVRGLRGAVDSLIKRVGMPVATSVTPERLPPAVEAAAYFVCSEALTNATKHARATTICVEVSQSDGLVDVTIADDGVGGADASGSGLRGLADRVAALGGVLTVVDSPAGGTLVTARIPTEGGT